MQAGAFGQARDLLAEAEAGPLDEFGGARVELLRGQIAFASGPGSDALPLLLKAAMRTAHDLLAAIGMAGFAERARRELIAAGETLRKHSVETVTTLTAQGALIARLARDRRTNPEIGAQLFLSGRTVEWHLRKVFTKLGISSRRDLYAALSQAA